MVLLQALILHSVRALALALLLASAAQAQDTGFAIDRFDRAEAGSDWFSGESLDLRGRMRPAIGLVFDYAHEPLVLYRANGDKLRALVRDQLYANLGGSLVVADRLRFALNVPLVLTQRGEPGSVPGTAIDYTADTSLGDVRVGVDARLLGEYREPFTLAFGLQMHVPTGSRDAYSGDGGVRLVPRLMIAGNLGDRTAFVYSARIAYAFRGQNDGIGGVKTGSELAFVGTAGARFDWLVIGPELWASTVLSDAFTEGTTPAEILLGAHASFGDWKAGLGAGTGLARGLGAPAWRVLASFEWAPVYEKPELAVVIEPAPVARPVDSDLDGIDDAHDACVSMAGVPNADRKKHGCPADLDGDGIVDDEDDCKEQPGIASEEPGRNGCAPDADRDGVPDAVDACKDVAGAQSADPEKHGCPKDSDGDTILDTEDACPDAAGERNADAEKHGCPIARVEKGEIKITERIEFKSGSAKILPASDGVLNAVLAILEAHPEITRLSLDGHTDDVGRPKKNLKLSQERTDAVKKWLITHGVDASRLEAHGFGSEQPIASNDTEEGREKNRRVEFHIIPDQPDMVFEKAR